MVAAALAAFYLASRLWFVAGLPYFLDEGIFAGFSYAGRQSPHQLFVSLTIGKEPLQAWFGIGWQVLGVNPLMSMRLVSMIAGLLSLGSIGLLGRRVAGTAVGLVSAALCVVLPFFVVNDGVGIEEPLVTLVMSSALLVQIELAEHPRLRWGSVLGLIWAAGIMTKQSCEAAVGLVPLSLLCLDWTATDRSRRLARWLGAVAIAAVAGVVSAEVVLRSSGYWATGQAFSRLFPLVRPLGQVLSHPFATTANAWSVFRPAVTGYVTLPVAALASVGAVISWRRRPRMTALLALWVILPFVVALIFTLHPYPRHVMYALPPVIVFAAETLVGGVARARVASAGRWRIPASAVVVVLLLAPALLFDVRALAHPPIARYPGLDDLQYVTGVPAGGAWPGGVAAIRRRAVGTHVVVLAAEADPNVVRFLLSADPRAPGSRYRVVVPSQPLSARAQFALVDQLPFSNPPALRFIAQHHFAVVGRFPRPRGGATVTLYERPPR